MSWASFHVVEVMSSPKFLYKGIGYLGAIQSFNQETDVLMLTTNLIKKVRFIATSYWSKSFSVISQNVHSLLIAQIVPPLIGSCIFQFK